MNDTKERAETLRLRVYRVMGYGAISQIARDLGENRSYVSQVLNSQATSNPLLDRIETYLNEHEQAAA